MSKTIMIADDIYKALTRLKRPSESYTDLLARCIGITKTKKKSLLECAGLWKHLSSKDVERIEKSIEKSRKSWRVIEW